MSHNNNSGHEPVISDPGMTNDQNKTGTGFFFLNKNPVQSNIFTDLVLNAQILCFICLICSVWCVVI